MKTAGRARLTEAAVANGARICREGEMRRDVVVPGDVIENPLHDAATAGKPDAPWAGVAQTKPPRKARAAGIRLGLVLSAGQGWRLTLQEIGPSNLKRLGAVQFLRGPARTAGRRSCLHATTTEGVLGFIRVSPPARRKSGLAYREITLPYFPKRCAFQVLGSRRAT